MDDLMMDAEEEGTGCLAKVLITDEKMNSIALDPRWGPQNKADLNCEDALTLDIYDLFESGLTRVMWEKVLKIVADPAWETLKAKSYNSIKRNGRQCMDELNAILPTIATLSVTNDSGETTNHEIGYHYILSSIQFLYSVPTVAKQMNSFREDKSSDGLKRSFNDFIQYQTNPTVMGSATAPYDPPLLLLYADGLLENRHKNVQDGRLFRLASFLTSLGSQEMTNTMYWFEHFLIPVPLMNQVGLFLFLEVIVEEILWIQKHKPLIFDSSTNQWISISTDLYAVLGDLEAAMKIIGFTSGGWDVLHAWCHKCKDSKRQSWLNHDIPSAVEPQKYSQIREHVLPILSEISGSALTTSLVKETGWRSVSPLWKLPSFDINTVVPCIAHHNWSGNIKKHISHLLKLIQRMWPMDLWKALELQVTRQPCINNSETFTKLCIKGFTIHQVMSLSRVLLVAIPAVFNLNEPCNCGALIPSEEQKYFRLTPKHLWWDHYIALREAVHQGFAWMTHVVDPIYTTQHANHALQVLRLVCALYTIAMYTRKSHDEVFHFGEVQNIVGPLRLLITLTGERGNQEVGNLNSNRRNVANNKLQRLLGRKMMKIFTSASQNSCDSNFHIRRYSLSCASNDLYEQTLSYISDSTNFTNVFIAKLNLITKLKMKRPTPMTIVNNCFVSLFPSATPHPTFGQVINILLAEIKSTVVADFSFRLCLVELETYTFSTLHHPSNLPQLKLNNEKKLFNISSISSLVGIMPAIIPSDFTARAKKYFWNSLPGLPLVLWDNTWLWNNPAAPEFWKSNNFPPEYYLDPGSGIEKLSDIEPDYKQKWKKKGE